MLLDLPFLAIDFIVRTVILLVLFRVMIKLQKFDRKYEHRFLKLITVAAFASALDLIPYAGHFLAVLVLVIGFKKVIHADYVESLFTVVIACALVFGLDRFLLGPPLAGYVKSRVETVRPVNALQPPFPKKTNEAPPAPAVNVANVASPPAPRTNLPTPKTNPPAIAHTNRILPPTNPPPVPVPHIATNPPRPTPPKPAPVPAPPTNVPAPVTNAAPPVAATNPAPPPPPPPPPKPQENLTKYFTVIGVTRNGANSAVTIQTGKKTYMISLGEAALTQTTVGPVSVRFTDMDDHSVTLEVNGETMKIPAN